MTVTVYFDRRRKANTNSPGRWCTAAKTEYQDTLGRPATSVKIDEHRDEIAARDHAAKLQEMES